MAPQPGYPTPWVPSSELPATSFPKPPDHRTTLPLSYAPGPAGTQLSPSRVGPSPASSGQDPASPFLTSLCLTSFQAWPQQPCGVGKKQPTEVGEVSSLPACQAEHLGE